MLVFIRGVNRIKVGCPVCSCRQGIKIVNVDTGEEFDNLSEAARSCNRTNMTNIQKCINGEISTAYGYHWTRIVEHNYISDLGDAEITMN